MNISATNSRINTGTAATTETLVTCQGYILDVNMSNVTKLNTSNYLMWSCQVHALLEGYDLADFLDSSAPLLEQVLTFDGTTTTNPEDTLHMRHSSSYSALFSVPSRSTYSRFCLDATPQPKSDQSYFHLHQAKPWSHKAIEISNQTMEERY